ncbi:MAG: hypothetical protein K9H64_03090 [Bacteroidales bacterium]|nr:hypothetical protein [Bacteroidales bacterium]MCF8454472.1 hypothetical protein [Bacteroidales bacterium]
MNLLLVSAFTFIFNLPFGYWRANVKRYSWQWVFAIHIPVPVIIILRIFSGIGFAFITYPALIGSFFLGQFVGGKIYRYCKKSPNSTTSSCLVMDLIRHCS